MEPLNDEDLDRLLTDWRAPLPPAGVPRKPTSLGWRWLWRGTFRVPVPVALAVIIAVLYLGLSALNAHTAISPQPRSRLSDFRPGKQVQIRVLRGTDYEQN